MRAWAVLIIISSAAAFAATPSFGFGRAGGPHPGGLFHGGAAHGHAGHGRGLSPFLGDGYGFGVLPVVPEPEDASAPDEPLLELPPAPRCAVAPAPARSSGPHIIYIGHRPNVRGPKVIYGTD